MKFGNCTSLALVISGFLLVSRAAAAPFTLNTGSFVQADVFGASASPSTKTAVSSIPYVTPATASIPGDGSTATITPNLTSTAFSFAYSVTIPNLQDYEADGTSEIHFTANAGVQYAITGTETSDSSATGGSLSLQFTDQTNSAKNPFSAYVAGTSVVLSPGGTGETGSLTGSLVAGDSYVFSAGEFITPTVHAGTLTGNISITFTQTAPIPEPSSAFLLLAGAPLLARRRRAA